MGIIRTSFKISQIFKNMTRLKEITYVLAKNGLQEILQKSGIISMIPDFILPDAKEDEKITHVSKDGQRWSSILGPRLRKSFEELGPSFIKIGQLLSTREDIFDQSFINEMKKLLNDVGPIPFAQAKQVIEKNLKQSLEELFEWLDPNPIGTASIGVVYRGRLQTGKEVVVKVRRPNIVKLIETDMSILLFIFERLEKADDELKYLGLGRLIQDFAVAMQNELDFNIERLNLEKMKKNISKLDKEEIFYIPQIYPEYCTDEVLIMEFLNGVTFRDTETIRPHLDIIGPKLMRGIHVFIDTLLKDGMFHADLHGGNFFLLTNNKIGIIDFGLVGHLTKKGRKNLIVILYCLLSQQYDNLVYEFLDVADYDRIPDIDKLERDIRDCLIPFIGLTVQQTNFTLMLTNIMRTLSDNKIYLPRDWFMVFRALMTLDGVGRSLGLDFDIYSLLDSNIQNNISDIFSKEDLIDEGMWIGRDLFHTFRSWPRHLKWFFREWAKRNYGFEITHKGYNKELISLSSSVYMLGVFFLSGMIFLSGSLLLLNIKVEALHDIPKLSWFMWLISLFLIVLVSFKSRKINKNLMKDED